jgi:hypothetical protein
MSSLENLLRAKVLAAEPSSADEIGRLLAGAATGIEDSRQPGLSPSGRFMLAYSAAHALALAALRAEGLRAASSQGHRKMLFQVLDATAGAPREMCFALDRYHDRRNASEYDAAPPATAVEADDLVELTERLQELVLERLRQRHPAFLK